MLILLSSLTAVKDYLQIVHTFLESQPQSPLMNYWDGGAVLTYVVLLVKQLLVDVFTFEWLRQLGGLPQMVPDISSAMVSELSVWNQYAHQPFSVLDNPLVLTPNVFGKVLEQAVIGFLNSAFFLLPSSLSHIIIFRRFLLQGVPSGRAAAWGTLLGNISWITAVIFGWRFLVIPWISLDWLRYGLGFTLVLKYCWDTQEERRQSMIRAPLGRYFFLNFLLAWTEQVTVYPFVSQLSMNAGASPMEGFAVNTWGSFVAVHGAYVLGLLLGSVSLLAAVQWFWENPFMRLYNWLRTTYRQQQQLMYLLSTDFVRQSTLFLTMFAAMASFPYHALDYWVLNPLGFAHPDRLVYRTNETVGPSPVPGERIPVVKNHPWDLLGWFSERPEDIERSTEGSMRTKLANRWRRHVRRFKGFDSMLYDTGTYHLLSPEDVNFGFDRFWMRRGMRRKQIRFRLIPGPPARRLKRAVAKSRLTNQGGIRHEFFDRLEEQAFSSSLHEQRRQKRSFFGFGKLVNKTTRTANPRLFWPSQLPGFQDPVDRAAWVRKFARKASMRLRQMELVDEVRGQPYFQGVRPADRMSGWVYSKFWKYARQGNLPSSALPPSAMLRNAQTDLTDTDSGEQTESSESSIQMSTLKKNNAFPSVSAALPNGGGLRSDRALDRRNMSRMERQWLRYASLLKRGPQDPAVPDPSGTGSLGSLANRPTALKNGQGVQLLHPLQFYLQRERALERKWQYYRPKVTRRYAPGQTPTFFRTILNRVFVYPRATRRWHTTMEVAQNEVASAGSSKGRRKRTKTSRLQKRWEPSVSASANKNVAMSDSSQLRPFAKTEAVELSRLQKPTHSYRIGSVNASRYRHHMLKQTLENWYYQRPLRRFLMAWDIDSFLRRQPRAHRLSPAEETLLHVRRGLLLDHYNTLRWYRWMQHYSSMKQATGGVKSAANTLYAQQFQGTLKNVRHLFVLTPSDGPRRRLTFDQPLINEYVNTSDASLVDQSWMHEELLRHTTHFNKIENADGLEQMRDGLKGYNQRASNVRAHLLQAWVKSKRPFELAQFDLKGQKTRGQAALTQERRWAHQEAPNLLTYADWTKQQTSLNVNRLDKRTAQAWMQHLKTSSRFLRPLKLTRKRNKERLSARLRRWDMRNQRAERLRQQARRWMGVKPQRPRVYGLESQGTRTPTGLVQGYVDALQDTYASDQATVLRGRAAVTGLSNWQPISVPEEVPSGLVNTIRARLSRLLGWRGVKGDQSPWDEKLQSQWRAAESLDQDYNNAPRSYPNAQTEAQRLLEQLGNDPKTAKAISKQKSLDPVYMQQLRFQVRAKKPLQELEEIEKAPPKGAGVQRFMMVGPMMRDYLHLIIKDETLKKQMRRDPNFRTFKKEKIRERMAQRMGWIKKRMNLEARMLIEADQPTALTQQIVGTGQRMLNRDREAVDESVDRNLVEPLRELRPQFTPGKRLFFKQDGDNENVWKSGSQREIGRPMRELGINLESIAADGLNVWHAPGNARPLSQNLPLSKPGTPNPLSATDVTQEIVDRTLLESVDVETVWKEYAGMTALAPPGEYNAGALKRLIALTDHLKRRRAEEVANFGWWAETLPRLQNETTDLASQREQQLKSMLQDPAIQKLYPMTERSQTLENVPLGTLDRWPGHVTLSGQEKAAISNETGQLEKGQRWQSTHPMPFYAGWDESQRKLVVTNRLRSRLEMVDDFQHYPLRGLNEGSGSWNLPFVTFAPIQNSQRAKDIFAPLGWRRLQLRHSLIQAWQRAPRSALRLNGAPGVTTHALVVQPSVWNRSILDRVKQTQRAQQRARLSYWHSPYDPDFLLGKTSIPLSAPDVTGMLPGYPANRVAVGPLSAEVLPNHFLWAFQPRDSRLSRVRYMSRWPQTEWRSGFERKKERILGPSQDFTWRRRALPKRKRHRKWSNRLKGQNRARTMVEPRRRAWLKADGTKKRWRPSGYGMSMRMITPMKGDKDPSRLRLTRPQYRDPRMLSYQRQQIIPLPGGFLWPGDYARLQAMPIPLERASLYDPSSAEDGQKEARPMAVRRAKRAREVSLPDLTHDPVTYLAERHNQVVLKKRLRKTGHASQSYGI